MRPKTLLVTRKGRHAALNGIGDDGRGRICLYSDFDFVYRLDEVYVRKHGGESGKK